ncbi:ATPase, partial [Holdemanella biformis]|nr:ATPase [Holdemanella biformis]MBV4152198.1 ATPase [Holdemanella biformis]
MEIKVYPFSFKEYLTYYKITDRYDDAFDKYVKTGGMPGAYVYKTEDRQYDYVRDIYSTILIRDLVEKYKIRNKLEFT